MSSVIEVGQRTISANRPAESPAPISASNPVRTAARFNNTPRLLLVSAASWKSSSIRSCMNWILVHWYVSLKPPNSRLTERSLWFREPDWWKICYINFTFLFQCLTYSGSECPDLSQVLFQILHLIHHDTFFSTVPEPRLWVSCPLLRTPVVLYFSRQLETLIEHQPLATLSAGLWDHKPWVTPYLPSMSSRSVEFLWRAGN